MREKERQRTANRVPCSWFCCETEKCWVDLGSSHLFKCVPLKRQSVAHNSLNSLFSCFNPYECVCVSCLHLPLLFFLQLHFFPSPPSAVLLCWTAPHFFYYQIIFHCLYFVTICEHFCSCLLNFMVVMPPSLSLLRCSSCHFFLGVCVSARVIVVLFRSLSPSICIYVFLLLFATENATDFVKRFFFGWASSSVPMQKLVLLLEHEM